MTRQPVNGFTLVETLVALMVFGLLAAAGVAILGNSVDAQRHVETVTGSVQDMQRLRAALRADLAQAASRPSRDENGASRPAFESGDDNGILFSLVRRGWENPDGAPRPGLQYVTYRLHAGQLERLSRPLVDGAAFGPPAILLKEVSAVTLAYHDGDGWREAWTPENPALLPRAVRLDLTTARFGTLRQLFLTSALP